jgi:beta-lactam-binding protein with PASTA domain
MVRRGSAVGLHTCPPLLVEQWHEAPDLNGLSLAQARQLAQSLGLKLRIAYVADCYEPFRQGVIISQQPEPRSLIRKGGLLIARFCGPRP